MNIFEQFDTWLAKLQGRFRKKKYLKYTRTLKQMVLARGVDTGVFTCTFAKRINRQYGLWYVDQLERHFQRLGQSHSLTPFHKFVGYKIRGWERAKAVYDLRLEFIDELIKDLECPHTPLSSGPLLQ